jgi:hypothetical protein
MTNKQMKKLSTSLVMKEMQIKTSLRFHFTPVRMATFMKTNRGIQRKGTLALSGGNVN